MGDKQKTSKRKLICCFFICNKFFDSLLKFFINEIETESFSSVKYWAYANKEHTKFRNKCRKCTNWDSKISHRINRSKRIDK